MTHSETEAPGALSIAMAAARCLLMVKTLETRLSPWGAFRPLKRWLTI
jgi:hypothetical protein